MYPRLAVHGCVVVAQHGEVAPRADKIAAAVRIRTVTNRISKTNEAIDLLPFRRFDARRERLQVGVDIRQDCGAHRRRPEYTAVALTSRAPDASLRARWRRLLERRLTPRVREARRSAPDGGRHRTAG